MLNQDQRIEISKKIISLPDENKAIDASIAITAENEIKIQNLDDGNKTFFDEKNLLVNYYQTETSLIDGDGRTQIVEQDLLDAADLKVGNVFFPNDPLSLPPSLSGVWLKMNPFLLGYGIGKTKLETYTPIANEMDLIASINSNIALIEAYTAIQRSTGQNCTIEPMPPDTIAADPALQALAASVLSDVSTLQTVLTNMQASIYLSDPDPARSSANLTAFNSIGSFLTAISTWISYPTFDPSTGATTCTAFNAYDPMLLLATKFRSDVLNPFKSAITTRSSYRPTRYSQITTWLGTVAQNISTGAITTSGFYGDRALFIVQRLNRLAGSLQELRAIQNGADTNQQFKDANIAAQNTYATVMVATKFMAPANGGNRISVLNPNFATGQIAYICSNTRPEIEVVIRSVSGNTIEVSQAIPPSYKESDGARLYRIL